jgi:Tfp pilus assembly protein PilO
MTAKRYFYILSGILFVTVIGGGAAYYYASGLLHAKTVEYSQRQADLQIADEKILKLEDLQRQYQRLTPVIGDLEGVLPKTKKQSELAVDLYNLAAKNGMTLSSLDFPAPSDKVLPGPTSQTTKAGDALGLPVNFKLTGTYDQLEAFLKDQEHLKRLTNVSSLSIESSNPNAIAFTLVLTAYVKP